MTIDQKQQAQGSEIGRNYLYTSHLLFFLGGYPTFVIGIIAPSLRRVQGIKQFRVRSRCCFGSPTSFIVTSNLSSNCRISILLCCESFIEHVHVYHRSHCLDFSASRVVSRERYNAPNTSQNTRNNMRPVIVTPYTQT